MGEGDLLVNAEIVKWDILEQASYNAFGAVSHMIGKLHMFNSLVVQVIVAATAADSYNNYDNNQLMRSSTSRLCNEILPCSSKFGLRMNRQFGNWQTLSS